MTAPPLVGGVVVLALIGTITMFRVGTSAEDPTTLGVVATDRTASRPMIGWVLKPTHATSEPAPSASPIVSGGAFETTVSSMIEVGSTDDSVTSPAAPPAEAPAIPAVVLGDSLAVQATEALRARLPGVLIDALDGRTLVVPAVTDAGIARVPALAEADSAWFVVELGTNDATFAGYPAEQLAADIETILDSVGRDRCVAWVLPFATSPRTERELADTAGFRSAVRSAVDRLSCNRVLDWGALAATEPNLLGPDGVHLTELGAERMADLIAVGVDGLDGRGLPQPEASAAR